MNELYNNNFFESFMSAPVSLINENVNNNVVFDYNCITTVNFTFDYENNDTRYYDGVNADYKLQLLQPNILLGYYNNNKFYKENTYTTEMNANEEDTFFDLKYKLQYKFYKNTFIRQTNLSLEDWYEKRFSQYSQRGMTTEDFINQGIPDNFILENCDDANYCLEGCFCINKSPFEITSPYCKEMRYAYAYSGLIIPPNLPKNVINIQGIFKSCKYLEYPPVIPDNVKNLSSAFEGCQRIKYVPEIPFNVNNLFLTFCNCQMISETSFISDSVRDMSYAFMDCINLNYIKMLPNNVYDLNGTFKNCRKILYSPSIPDSVRYLNQTFENCFNLIEMPKISNNTVSLFQTFSDCINMKYVQNIPKKVTTMDFTFQNCRQLSGDLFIFSKNIISAHKCFEGHGELPNTPLLNVFCYYYSKTWNTFYNYFSGNIDNNPQNIHLLPLQENKLIKTQKDFYIQKYFN